MLFEKYGIIWCCEGDTLTLISTYVLYQSLRQPIMMTNIYPFRDHLISGCVVESVADHAAHQMQFERFLLFQDPQHIKVIGIHPQVCQRRGRQRAPCSR